MSTTIFRLKIASALLGLLLAGTLAKNANADTPLRLISYTAPSGNWVFVVPMSNVNQGNLGVYAFKYSSAGWQPGYVGEQDGNHYPPEPSTGYYYGNTSPAIGSTIMGYYSPGDHDHHLFFINGNDGHIHEWFWPDGSMNNFSPANGAVSDRDVTYESNSPLPAGTLTNYSNGTVVTGPATLTGFVDSSYVGHVYYTDNLSRVHELYYSSGQWWEGSPAGQANALDGKGMTSLWDGAREHIYFTGLDGSLWEDWFSSGWQSHALTGSTGVVNPKITVSQSPSGYLVAMLQGTQEIFGPSTDGLGMRAVIYDTSAGWESDEFTGLGNLSVDSPMVAYNNWWFYEGMDQRIYLPGISFSQSLQAMFGGLNVAMIDGGAELGPISGFVDSSNNSHIFYIGTDGNLWEYYSSNMTYWSVHSIGNNNFQ